MLETLLKFRNLDSSENINARLAGLIPKGIVKGGLVVPEPASLQVRIKGDGESPYILLAFASDGMVIRERSEEHVLAVEAGITSVIALRAKYVESQDGTIARFEVIPLGSYQNDPDPASLVRLCSVTPPAGSTAVLAEHIDMGYRDSIEGFTRRIVREVVGTKEDLPAVSGFPAIAEINFLGNDFVLGSTITMGTGAGLVSFPIVSAVNFSVAPPSVPGLSRVNPSQRSIVAVTQNPISGLVTAVTSTPHGFIPLQWVRISGNGATQANQLWQLSPVPGEVTFVVDDIVSNLLRSNSHGFSTGMKVRVSNIGGALPSGLVSGTDYYLVVMSTDTFKLSNTFDHAMAGTDIISVIDAGTPTNSIAPQADTAFFFMADLITPWSGTGGVVVDTTTNSLVVAKTAAGVTHSLVAGNQFTLIGATDGTFDSTSGFFTVDTVIDAQTFNYYQSGYPTADSGNGTLHKEGGYLPTNAIEIGESATGTAINFETTFNASLLGPDVAATAIGSSLQFVANTVGEIGNTYTLTKTEPGVLPADEQIVLSGNTFAGGVDPNPSTTTNVDLLVGDLYVVMYGTSGTMEIWGYDGVIFRNLTSASTATLLDFHRRNQFLNEKHVTENEKGALVGSVGVPSATNRYLTQADTSTLTLDIAAALTGADNTPPSDTNRYLTEARKRGERDSIAIPALQDWVEVPTNISEQLITGLDTTGTDSSYAVQFFNVVFTKSLYDPVDKTDRGGPTEYSQKDFSPVFVDKIYVAKDADVIPPFPPSPPSPLGAFAELNPTLDMDSSGLFPKADALIVGTPTRLFAKLSQVPDNGNATLLYSRVITEKTRKPPVDMLATPQRILPAQVQDLINRTKELRFNAGITLSDTTITFPDNLFSSSNSQEFLFKRIVGSKATGLTSGFSIDFATGAVTGDVDTVSLVPFAGLTLGKWTKYLLVLTPAGRIQVRSIISILQNLSDTAYATSFGGVSSPSLPFSDGSYVFASIGVQSDGVAGTSILDLQSDSLELYPYQGTNAKDYGAPIVCGDGVDSFGHFTGTDAHIRAVAYAPVGSFIQLGVGTYYGTLLIDKDDITLDGSSGAVFSAISSTALIVVGKRLTVRNLHVKDCNFALDLQGGADDATLVGIVYGSGVGTKLKAPSIYSFSPADVAPTPINAITLGAHSLIEGSSAVFTSNDLPGGLGTGTYYVKNPTATTIQVATSPSSAPVSILDGGSGTHYFGTGAISGLEAKTTFNQWFVSDGTNTYGVGDFNSPSGIQQAHDAASPGDLICILPGTYSYLRLSKDQLQFRGIGGGKVQISEGVDPDDSTTKCLAITGSYNQFDNLVLTGATIGIDCKLGSTFNTFSPTVVFSTDVITAIRMPQTDTVKHYNYHPLVSGKVMSFSTVQQNIEVTVGDGVSSWGDYVGLDAINVAIAGENEGVKIVVRPGTYNPFRLNRNNFVIEGSGAKSVIRAMAPTDTACITIVNSGGTSGEEGNKVSGFYLVAMGNERPLDPANNLDIVGVTINGYDNHIENIMFEDSTPNRIERHKRYEVTSGFRNKFSPHTGAPTGYISWVVGDGIHSFGDFTGEDAIGQAIGSLPTYPSSGTVADGVLSSAAGDTVIFSSASLTFAPRDLHRYVCIKAGPNSGSFRIIDVTTGGASVTLVRTDGLTFSNGTNLYWSFITGAKIWVLPGQYSGPGGAIIIPAGINDVDIEAWGAGHDTLIVNDVGISPLLRIEGNRCRVKGFRFASDTPGCVAVEIIGSNNVFTENQYETDTRFSIGANAFGNQIYDAPEAVDRTYLTVSNYPSRGDFVGDSETSIQAALDAASLDPHLNKVVLGKGTWTLTTTIDVPAGITLEGSGYMTELLGDGLFPALTLNAGGNQTVTGIRFNTFSDALIGPAAGVFAYGNWLESATINVNVTGEKAMNII